MNKLIKILLISLISMNLSAQNIKELEYELSIFEGGESYTDKIEQARKLLVIDPFNYRGIEFMLRYYEENKIDSTSLFFDNLIKKYPNKVEPLLLRSELLYFEHDFRNKIDYVSHKVKYLDLAYKIDQKNLNTLFALSETYYKDFIFPLEKEKDWGLDIVFEDDWLDSLIVAKEKPIKKSTFEHSADSSLYYFYKLWDLQYDIRESIYFPIRQLECFLKQMENSPIPKEIESNFIQCYFPSSYFVNLTENWECDFTTDYLFEIESSKRTAEWLDIQLSDLREDCLYNNDIRPNTTIYRFTWLRSFDHPIAIRIERIEDDIVLYWKVGKGAGGYEPKGLKKSGKKKLNLKEWGEFERLIKESNFDTLPNEKYIPMTDGATWTLERKKSESFKAHNTNWPSPEIKRACLYLLNLTNIRVKDEDIY